jgi:hypothetical protein
VALLRAVRSAPTPGVVCTDVPGGHSDQGPRQLADLTRPRRARSVTSRHDCARRVNGLTASPAVGAIQGGLARSAWPRLSAHGERQAEPPRHLEPPAPGHTSAAHGPTAPAGPSWEADPSGRLISRAESPSTVFIRLFSAECSTPTTRPFPARSPNQAESDPTGRTQPRARLADYSADADEAVFTRPPQAAVPARR